MPPPGTGLTITNPLVLYRSLIATNRIAPDPSQHRLALHLQKLYESLIDYEPSIEYSQRLKQLSRAVAAGQNARTPATTSSDRDSIGARGIWTSLLAKKEERDSLALTRVLTSHEAAMGLHSPKGLMLHGEVGTGKSMLIDLFADCLPNRKKRRWHFNTFMLDTISRLESLRKSRTITSPSGLQDEYSLLWLARDLIEQSPILFLDEFQLPDRAASKILSNLMTSFFQLGGVLIATSNRMPEELAKAAGMEFARPISRFSRLGWSLGMRGVTGRDDGPGQKGEFAQFLEVLRARCEVWEMEGKKDYRRLSGEEDGGVRSLPSEITITTGHSSYLDTAVTTKTEVTNPSGRETTALPKNYFIQPPASASPVQHASYTSALDAALCAATSCAHPIPWQTATLTVYGRALHIPRQHSGTAYFTFDELCGATLGPADYITLASTYHTLIITDIPILTFLQKNEARRLITCLDALYEARCRLLITAAAGPDDIFFPERAGNTTTTSTNPTSSSPSQTHVLTTTDDTLHQETYSEIHQDLTSPFRPNISSYTNNNNSTLAADALEDDPPNRFRRPGSSFTDERKLDVNTAPDFANIGGLTGEDERFAVKRALSRIWEMCSARWWSRTGTETVGVGVGAEEGELKGAMDMGWWRPLPLESRHWEGDVSDLGRRGEKVIGTRDTSVVSEVRNLGEGVDAGQEHLFAHGASPFRTTSDAPPKISWSHVWGTVKWGKRAGAWGQGVEGLDGRKKDKIPSESGSEKKT